MQEQLHFPLLIKELKDRKEELLEILGSPSRQFLVSLIKGFKSRHKQKITRGCARGNWRTISQFQRKIPVQANYTLELGRKWRMKATLPEMCLHRCQCLQRKNDEAQSIVVTFSACLSSDQHSKELEGNRKK